MLYRTLVAMIGCALLVTAPTLADAAEKPADKDVTVELKTIIGSDTDASTHLNSAFFPLPAGTGGEYELRVTARAATPSAQLGTSLHRRAVTCSEHYLARPQGSWSRDRSLMKGNRSLG